MRLTLLLLPVLSLMISLIACGEQIYVPKPRAYPKIEFPEQGFKPFSADYCGLTFEQPIYTTVEQDKTFFKDKPNHPCWFNLQIPSLNGTIHFTYTPIGNKNDVLKLFKDAHRLSAEHNKVADFNDNFVFSNPKNKVYGIIYEIGGQVASSFQFAVTDSLNHSLRGSLYFNARPNADSLKPVVEFAKKDMMHILNTLQWEQN